MGDDTRAKTREYKAKQGPEPGNPGGFRPRPAVGGRDCSRGGAQADDPEPYSPPEQICG